MLIDVHGHLAPPGEKAGGPPGMHDPEGMIEAKLALGIGMTIIGSPVGAGSMLPGTGAANYRQDAATVRAHNEALAELARRHPAHLRCYAYLDPFAGEAMLAQAAELLAEPEFVGLVVNTSVEGRLLSSPRADDFFAFAAEAGVPVLLHPPAEPVGTDAVLDLGPGLVEHLARFNDVTLGVAAVVCAGRLERHPELRLIAPGGGGALGVLAEKLDLAVAPRPGAAADGRPRPVPSRSLRRVLVDTSCPNPAQLRANLACFGPEQVLFGTDAPPLMSELKRMTELVADLDPGTLTANAERIFKLGVRA
ncbi:amidohydrolase family protein [Nonomuraea gerenzanensis]|uniref:2-amino-3-carboxymuconate-6-semialdehyde decarboxylase n=1 Tax=Nonomuraea gerenzanensis TaxID=93944 RepID=A0A1M4EKN7_9ACTN|nr:amidohydrolase family protein [Nonomuraea gerenzanensis]UBU10965.1 amidohydrolase [Nonomuraea gerenzanensis]SBO99417.1 2-amino-3-carboxymuconate-6-semialdehyde decarboxylase [Nonomuraea gerenzanensis]